MQTGPSLVRTEPRGSLAPAARRRRRQACAGRKPRAASSEEAVWSWIWAQGRRLRAYVSLGTGERPTDASKSPAAHKDRGSCFPGRFRKEHSPSRFRSGRPAPSAPRVFGGTHRATGRQVLACAV